LTVQVARVY
nr:Chain C, Nonamer peptide: LEU-THR-VAL-GLN-VAL-ALA-ARG-VAL-TYR [synthetic construct]5VWF_C Chain C, Nonamer peptide: LEU-THR-VAL-GLN-VAL-ALA-ARG-VAL-TYR [synthetic construct]